MTTWGLEKHRGLSERDFDTLNCLNTLQSIYNGAKSRKLHALDNNMMKEFTAVANTFIDILKMYATRLALRTPTKYNPAAECKNLLEDLSKNTARNNLRDSDNEASEKSTSEKLVYERQMLAVIALLCTDFPNTTQSLLFEKCEDSSATEDDEMDGENRVGSFVDILTDIFCTIGHSVSGWPLENQFNVFSLLLIHH